MTTILKVRTIALGCVIAASAIACGNSDSTTAPANGTMVMQLTDAAFTLDSVQSANIFVVRIDGRQSDTDSTAATTGMSDDSATVGGWKTLAKPNAIINLMAYQNGATLTVGTDTLPAGNYLGFRFIIDPSQSTITLKSGVVLTGSSTPGIMFPSAARTGIKIALSSPITIAANGTTTMLVDFNLANSFVLRGNTIMQNGLLFKPVITGTVK